MESYLMMLYVTFEQETALKSFFLEHGWSFCKPDLSVTTDKVGPASGPSVAVPSQLVAVVSTEDHSTLDSSREESDQTKTGKRKSKQGKGPAEKVAKLWVEAGSSLEDSTAGPTIIAVTSGSQAETLTTATMDKEEPTVAVKEETVYSDYDQGNDEAYENESTDTEDGYENTTGEVDGQEVEEGEVQLNLDSSMTVKPREVKILDRREPQKCRLCGKLYLTKHSLKQHLDRHEGIVRSFSCQRCSALFTSKSNLMRHEQVLHCQIKKFECDLCGEQFGYSWKMAAHKSKEHGIGNKYVCNCEKVFFMRATYVRHRQSCAKAEGAEKPPKIFQCSECQKIFKTIQTLKGHVRTVHNPDATVFICEQCGANFTRSSSLKRHRRRRHRQLIQS